MWSLISIFSKYSDCKILQGNGFIGIRFLIYHHFQLFSEVLVEMKRVHAVKS